MAETHSQYYGNIYRLGYGEGAAENGGDVCADGAHTSLSWSGRSFTMVGNMRLKLLMFCTPGHGDSENILNRCIDNHHR